MPGLFDTCTWMQLPLEASCVNACASGYSLGLHSHLTYRNTSSETMQAIFIYLLEEGEVVTSFEAVTGNRKVQTQIQSQSRIEECCFGCQWEALPCYCPNGHLVLDADTAHNVFVLSVGAVHPSSVVSVTLQSCRELQTLPGGTVRVTLNSTLTPLALSPGDPSEHGDGLCDDRLCLCPASCFGGVSGAAVNSWLLLPDSPSQLLHSTHPRSLSAALTGLATNPQSYHFTFQLQVQGPCLLAGIESPSHALRADASPFALSASSIWISLAEEYKCDRALEVILHLSEPHLPHLCLESGTKSFSQYEAHIKERKDFIKGMKKSSDPERQVNFVRRRFHKDLNFNPVLMLNFCPDLAALSTLSSDLPTVTREVIFIVHLMGEPSRNVRESLLLAVRSLPARILLNIACCTGDSRALFPASRQCSNDALELACDFIQSNRLCGTTSNLFSVLGRIMELPVHRGYPRQLFMITDTDFINTSRILELIRRHTRTTRVFGFGLGSSICHRFLEKVCRITRGTVELVSEGERLQPKLINALKKALEPALSDITIDWYMPETMEALLTPNEIAPLYPGDCLISYCTLYNIASFRSKKAMARVTRGGSLSSVFQSHEESQTSGTTDASCLNQSAAVEDVERALQEISHEISLEFSAWSEDPERSESTCVDGAQVSDIRRRIVRSSYVQDQYVLTHCSVSTEPTRALTQPSISSDRTRAPSHGSTSSESVGSRDTVSGECMIPCYGKVSQQGQKTVLQSEGAPASNKNITPPCKTSVGQSSEELVRRKALIQATMFGRSFSSPHGELDMLRLRTVLDKVSQSRESEDEGRVKRSEGLTDSCQFPSPAQLDWDMLVDAQYLFSASPATEGANVVSAGSSDSGWQCRAVIHGYIGGKSHSWNTTVNLEPLLCTAEDGGNHTESEKCCNLHHLAAHSVIQDNEDMAWRESDIEHSSSRRFRLKAMQSSKSCSQTSSFTCYIPVDSSTQEVVPGHKIVCRGEQSRRSCSSNSTRWSAGDNRGSENMDDLFENGGRPPVSPSSPLRLPSENSMEKLGVQEGQFSNSFGSQKSSDASLSSRISVGKKKIRSMSGKLSPLKPCLTGDKEPSIDLVVQDYLPLISLQFAEGFFSLNNAFSSVVQISLQRLLRTSPFSCHRGSLSPVSEPFPSEAGECLKAEAQNCKGGSQPEVPATQETSFLPVYASSCPEALCHQADSGRGSETDPCDTSPCPSEAGAELDTDLEGSSWATAVALAWLEHRCAGFFTEWELLAAKAEGWLRTQTLPDGLQLPALKGAARQLFLLLRHWDENLNLNMLCYKPGDV